MQGVEFNYETVITTDAVNAHKRIVEKEAAKEVLKRQEAARILHEEKQALALKFSPAVTRSKSI